MLEKIEHTHEFKDGICECGAADPNYVPPHEHNYIEGKCECGETDPNYVPPHEHNYIEGKCECGETDPNYIPPADPEPNPAPIKKKCGKKSTELFISMISLTAVIGIFFRKRK